MADGQQCTPLGQEVQFPGKWHRKSHFQITTEKVGSNAAVGIEHDIVKCCPNRSTWSTKVEGSTLQYCSTRKVPILESSTDPQQRYSEYGNLLCVRLVSTYATATHYSEYRASRQSRISRRQTPEILPKQSVLLSTRSTT